MTELRGAWRGVRARGIGAVVHVAFVALAVGASAAAFSAADSFVFRVAPYPNARRMMVFQRTSPVGVIDAVQPGEYAALSARSDIFRAFYAHAMGPTIYPVTAAGVEVVRTYDVQPGLFEALGVLPRWGRPLVADDASAGGGGVLIREDLARQLFGTAAAAIGRTIDSAGLSWRVVGVMPAGFRFPTAVEQIWRPLADASPPRGARQVIAAVAPGIPTRTAAAVVNALTRARPVDPSLPLGPIRAVPLTEAVRDPRAFTNAGAFTALDGPLLFTMLLGAAIGLALVICLNLAGLELASSLGRGHAHAIETALGATRGALVRRSLLESAILTTAGALAGVGFAAWGTAALAAALPGALNSLLANPIDVGLRTGNFVAIVTFLTTVLTSLPVVWQVSRPGLTDRLRRNAPALTGSRTYNAVRSGLMASEIALCAMMLVVAVPLARTYAARLHQDNGVDGAGLTTVEVTRTPMAVASAVDIDGDIVARLRLDPGVRNLARTDRLLPGFRGGSAQYVWMRAAATPAGRAVLVPFGTDSGYFRTMGIRLLGGRWPDAGDGQGQIVVDTAFARRFWPDGRAVGARFSLGRAQAPGTTMYEIVGVASAVRLDTTQAPMGGEVFVSYHLIPADAVPLTYVVRLAATERLGDLVASIRSAAAGCLVRTRMMDDRYAEIYGDTRIAAELPGALGVLAFGVAMIGLYAVTTSLVARRTREIGIRLALGANRRDIRRLVLRPAMRGVLVGTIAGGCGAWLASRVVASQHFGIGRADPATFVGVAAVVTLMAIAATWRPARRAVHADSALTLRSE